MINNKIVSVFQIDCSQKVNVLLRGLSVLSLKKRKNNVIIDMRPNANIMWSYYGKNNIKYLDDILNIILDINISMLKSYLDTDSDILCVKDIKKIMLNDNFNFVIKSLSEIYNNIFISFIDNPGINDFLFLSDTVLFMLTKDPVSLSVYNERFSEFLINKRKNMDFIPVIFKADTDFNIDEKESDFFPKNAVSLNLSSEILKQAEHIKFMFNDKTNDLVASISDIVDMIWKDTKIQERENDNFVINSEQYLILKEKLHKDLIVKMKEYSNEQDKNVLSDIIKIKMQELLSLYKIKVGINIQQKISKELIDDIVGLGVIEDFLSDDTVTEIMVNGCDYIYVERYGKIEKTKIKFYDIEKLKIVINRIVSSIGRHVDEASPIVDARLKDGSRVNVIIAPISLCGPILTIRKFSKHKLSGNNLIDYGSLTQEMLAFLKNAVVDKKNILISGGTGSGKTTLLNVVSSFIGEKERIITIEDSAELQLKQEHVIRLESRPKSLEGTSEIPIRQLVINSLRMRPDRIIVGECRAGETLDMLQAMNTGHSGSMTTVHSNSCNDAISRLTVMSLMAGFDLPEKSIVSMIVSAIDIIVQVSRFPDGSRKISEISILQKDEKDLYKIIPVFIYDMKNNKFLRSKV